MSLEDDEVSDLESEIETLKSIYVKELDLQRDECGITSVTVHLFPATADVESEKYVRLSLTLTIPKNYPEIVPDIVINNTRGLSDEDIERIYQDSRLKAEEKCGNPMLFEIIQLVRDHLTKGNTPSCDCAICLCNFAPEDVFIKTECYHYFHSHCLATYVAHCNKEVVDSTEISADHEVDNESGADILCPICRLVISFDSKTPESFPVPQESLKAPEYVVTDQMRDTLREMESILIKQKSQGGIIDVEVEKNRFLLEISHDTTVPTSEAESLINEEGTNEIPVSQSESKPSDSKEEVSNGDGVLDTAQQRNQEPEASTNNEIKEESPKGNGVANNENREESNVPESQNASSEGQFETRNPRYKGKWQNNRNWNRNSRPRNVPENTAADDASHNNETGNAESKRPNSGREQRPRYGNANDGRPYKPRYRRKTTDGESSEADAPRNKERKPIRRAKNDREHNRDRATGEEPLMPDKDPIETADEAGAKKDQKPFHGRRNWKDRNRRQDRRPKDEADVRSDLTERDATDETVREGDPDARATDNVQSENIYGETVTEKPYMEKPRYRRNPGYRRNKGERQTKSSEGGTRDKEGEVRGDDVSEKAQRVPRGNGRNRGNRKDHLVKQNEEPPGNNEAVDKKDVDTDGGDMNAQEKTGSRYREYIPRNRKNRNRREEQEGVQENEDVNPHEGAQESRSKKYPERQRQYGGNRRYHREDRPVEQAEDQQMTGENNSNAEDGIGERRTERDRRYPRNRQNYRWYEYAEDYDRKRSENDSANVQGVENSRKNTERYRRYPSNQNHYDRDGESEQFEPRHESRENDATENSRGNVQVENRQRHMQPYGRYSGPRRTYIKRDRQYAYENGNNVDIDDVAPDGENEEYVERYRGYRGNRRNYYRGPRNYSYGNPVSDTYDGKVGNAKEDYGDAQHSSYKGKRSARDGNERNRASSKEETTEQDNAAQNPVDVQSRDDREGSDENASKRSAGRYPRKKNHPNRGKLNENESGGETMDYQRNENSGSRMLYDAEYGIVKKNVQGNANRGSRQPKISESFRDIERNSDKRESFRFPKRQFSKRRNDPVYEDSAVSEALLSRKTVDGHSTKSDAQFQDGLSRNSEDKPFQGRGNHPNYGDSEERYGVDSAAARDGYFEDQQQGNYDVEELGHKNANFGPFGSTDCSPKMSRFHPPGFPAKPMNIPPPPGFSKM